MHNLQLMQSEFPIILGMIAKEACERLSYPGHDCAKTYLWYPVQICKNEIGIMLYDFSWGVGRDFWVLAGNCAPPGSSQITT